MNRFVDNKFSHSHLSTVGIDFKMKQMKVELPNSLEMGQTITQNVKLQIWDTAGQERFRHITRNYFNKADGIMIVYDATNEETFLSVGNWIKQIE